MVEMDISVIIVNWNTRDLLRNCLESIRKTIKGTACEVIVVDNGSSDGSVDMLRSEYPEVRILENGANLGFAAANNRGFSIMSGRYALLLNTDAVLTENAVACLYEFMEKRPDAAMACGQLLNADGSRQNSIASFPTALTLLANMPLLEYLFPGKYPSKRYDYGEPIEVDSGIGACLMVRKKAMDEVGFLDERYFFFFEETDWACRMKRAGWKVYHVPAAKIYHLQGQSIGNDVRSRIEFYRSRYLFFRKWHGRGYYRSVSAIIFLRLLVNWLLTSLLSALTLGYHGETGKRRLMYAQLIDWHFKEWFRTGDGRP